jgi:hypothetical protein
MVLSQSGRVNPGKSELCLEALEMFSPQRDTGSVDEEHNPSREFYSRPPVPCIAGPHSIDIQLLLHLKVTYFLSSL